MPCSLSAGHVYGIDNCQLQCTYICASIFCCLFETGSQWQQANQDGLAVLLSSHPERPLLWGVWLHTLCIAVEVRPSSTPWSWSSVKVSSIHFSSFSSQDSGSDISFFRVPLTRSHVQKHLRYPPVWLRPQCPDEVPLSQLQCLLHVANRFYTGPITSDKPEGRAHRLFSDSYSNNSQKEMQSLK